MSDKDKKIKSEYPPPKFVRKTGSNVAEVEGNRLNFSHDRLSDRSLEEVGTVIKNLTNSTVGQYPPRANALLESGQQRGKIVLVGDEIRNNSFYQGHSGSDELYMKDAPGITGNTFHAGFKLQGTVNSLKRLRDNVTHALGSTALRTENDLIIMPGKREEYAFTFLNDKNPELGNYNGSVKIKHHATGAENSFENYTYIVFGGPENKSDESKYVELAAIKAEQEAKAAVAKTMPGNTMAKSDNNSSAQPDSLQAVAALSQHITQCMEKGQELEKVLGNLEKQYPGALQSMEHVESGEKLTPNAIAERIVKQCIQRVQEGGRV